MIRHTFGPMILAASILAVPVLAATSDNTVGSSPAASPHAAVPPTSNMGAGMRAADRPVPAGSVAATQPSKPLYTTGDGQVRLGKVVGASVYNDQHQSIGSVDDVLMGTDHKATMAVISVGGFLGMGGKLVSVPFDQLKIENDRIVMPGATKASLTSMPEYNYNKA